MRTKSEIIYDLMKIGRELNEKCLQSKSDADFSRYRNAVDKIYSAIENLK